ncbi:MAG: hypothetical protein H6641_05725 [Caldilineaceae bacterium]|nr:hypothetical protein [Caldilineaceae bacterium]
MTIQEQIDSEYAAILGHPIVRSSVLIRRSANRLDGYLRVRCILTNDDFLEIALHIALHNGHLVIDDYRYQWMNSTQTVLRHRWDNTPHFPDLPGFPHHCHVGHENNVEPAAPMDVGELLDYISDSIG